MSSLVGSKMMKVTEYRNILKLLRDQNSTPIIFNPEDSIPRPSPTWFVQKLDKYFKDDVRRYWQSGDEHYDRVLQMLVEHNGNISDIINGNLSEVSARSYQDNIIQKRKQIIQYLENFFLAGIQLNMAERNASVDFLTKHCVVREWVFREDNANSDSSESDNEP